MTLKKLLNIMLENIRLSPEWVEHLPDIGPGFGREAIVCNEKCPCGIKERHTHCTCCGKVITKGSGKIIKEYKFKFPRKL